MRAFYEALGRFRHHGGAYVNAFLVAPQLASVEFQQRAEAARETIAEMSAAQGLSPMQLGGEG